MALLNRYLTAVSYALGPHVAARQQFCNHFEMRRDVAAGQEIGIKI